MRERVCTRDFDLLTASFHPFYLPREFGQITVILVYVPGPDFKTATEKITESFNEAVSRSVDQPVFNLVDFNSCDLSPHLPTLQQDINCTTRLNRTIDLCYGNTDSAHRPVCRPPLGRSDHNVVHLLPKYRQKATTEGTQTKSCQLWTHDSIEELRGCFEATNWDVFTDNCSDPGELVDTVTSYVKFCEETVIKTKSVYVHPNNKPRATKDLTVHPNQNKLAFLKGRREYKEKEKDFRKNARADIKTR